MNASQTAPAHGLWMLVMYARLAHKEEREVAEQVGEVWRRYAEETPRWFPRLRHRPHEPAADHS